MKFHGVVVLLGWLLLSCQSEKEEKTEREQVRSSDSAPVLRAEVTQDLNRELESLRELLQADDGNLEERLRERLASDEGLTLRALSRLEGEFDYQRIGQILLDHYQNTDLEKGLSALQTLDTNLTLATPLMASFLTAHAAQNFDGAMEFLLGHPELRGAPHAAATLGGVAATQSDPRVSFSSLAEAAVPDAIKSNFISGLVTNWLQTDFNSALTHLAEQEPAPWLDQTYYNIIFEASRADPATTMLWAESITDEGLRRSGILQSAQQWMITDIEGYETWKEQAELPDDLLSELP